MNEQMLYVEDDPRDFEAYGDALTIDHEWKIDHVTGPAEAIKKLAERRYDVIVIDRQMVDPETGELRMVGDDLLENVAVNWPYVCPIIVTHFGDVEAAQRATRYGAYRYFVKGIPARELDQACRRGMRWQRVRRIRHELLKLESVEEIVNMVKATVAGTLQSQGNCFAYLKVVPGQTLMIGKHDCEGECGLLAKALDRDNALLADYPCAQIVVERRQFSLRSTREEIPAEEDTLISRPGSQLIVPVLEPGEPDTREPSKVGALIWVENVKENAYTRDDADILSELADYVGVALARARDLDETNAKAQKAEREGLISRISHRIRNPLQVAHGTADALGVRLKQGEEPDRAELIGQLEKIRNSIERAIGAASQLHLDLDPRQVTVGPVDLLALVTGVAESYGPRASSLSCAIDVKSGSGSIPHVMLNDEEMRYVFGCLLDNALEAIERARAGGKGEPETGSVRISLSTDGSQKTVLLAVQDNGCGVSSEALPRVFERYFSTKQQDFRQGRHGLGLWEVRRFIVAVDGTVELKRLPQEGALARIILPACGKTDPAHTITLE